MVQESSPAPLRRVPAKSVHPFKASYLRRCMHQEEYHSVCQYCCLVFVFVEDGIGQGRLELVERVATHKTWVNSVVAVAGFEGRPHSAGGSITCCRKRYRQSRVF